MEYTLQYIYTCLFHICNMWRLTYQILIISHLESNESIFYTYIHFILTTIKIFFKFHREINISPPWTEVSAWVSEMSFFSSRFNIMRSSSGPANPIHEEMVTGDSAPALSVGFLCLLELGRSNAAYCWGVGSLVSDYLMSQEIPALLDLYIYILKQTKR